MIFIKQEPVVALTLKIGSEVNIRIEATVFSRSANVVLSLKTLQKKKTKKNFENRTCYRYREL